MSKPLPQATPETQHFWDGCKAGELRLQRCRSCMQHYFPPRPFCPHCASGDVEIVNASGRATLYSYLVNHQARPEFGTALQSIAVVTLEEGPRMLSNIVDCPATPEALQLDMPLEVLFEKQNDTISLPFFRPATK